MAGIVPPGIRRKYEVHEWRNAFAILSAAHTEEWKDIIAVLRNFKLLKSNILERGKNKSKIATKIDTEFFKRGWKETGFETVIKVDEMEFESPTHKVDCFKNRVAIEVEWNNKDPFYDRDLNNFRLLYDLRVIDVGVIITRCDELQEIFNQLGKGSSYGASTTHMSKLLPRIEGGGGGGCPIAVFGIRREIYVEQ